MAGGGILDLTFGSSKFVAVTPSDTVPLSYNSVNKTCKRLMATVGGVIAVKNDLGTAVNIPVTAGVMYPVCAGIVMATGTTATGIVAFF